MARDPPRDKKGRPVSPSAHRALQSGACRSSRNFDLARDCRRVAFSRFCRPAQPPGHNSRFVTPLSHPSGSGDTFQIYYTSSRVITMICPWFRTEVSSYFGFRVSHARVFSLLNSHTKVLFDPLCFETSQFEPGEVSLSEKMGVRNAGWSPPVVTVPRQRCVPVPTPVQSLGTSSREDPRDASAPRVTHRSAPASRTVRQVASRIFTRRCSSWPHRPRRR